MLSDQFYINSISTIQDKLRSTHDPDIESTGDDSRPTEKKLAEDWKPVSKFLYPFSEHKVGLTELFYYLGPDLLGGYCSNNTQKCEWPGYVFQFKVF